MVRRLCLLIALVATALTGGATPAFAATGDSATDPLPLGSEISFSVAVDTTTATAEASDPFDYQCWERYSHTLFYSYTAPASALVSFSADNFRGAAAVYLIGADGSLDFAGSTCGGGEVRVPAGVPHLIMVGSLPECCGDDGYLPARGGQGTLSFRPAPPDVDVEVTLTKAVVNQRTGVARLSGTVTCNTPIHFSGYGELRQKVAGTAAAVTSGLHVDGSCGESGQAVWETTVAPGSGAFSVGAARLVLNLEGYNSYTTDADNIDQTVRLKSTRL